MTSETATSRLTPRELARVRVDVAIETLNAMLTDGRMVRLSPIDLRTFTQRMDMLSTAWRDLERAGGIVP